MINKNSSLNIFDKRTRFAYLKYTKKNKDTSPLEWFWELQLKEREYSFDEIATILKISKKEVIASYVKGIRKVRKLLIEINKND